MTSDINSILGWHPCIRNQHISYSYVGNSTEVDFSNYKYVGFNIPRPKRMVFWGINSTQSRIQSNLRISLRTNLQPIKLTST